MRHCVVAFGIYTTAIGSAFAQEPLETFKIPSTLSYFFERAVSGYDEKNLKNDIQAFALSAANAEINKAEQAILATTDFTHLEFSLGTDSFASDNGTDILVEAMSVYRLKETQNWFLFNQSSVVSFAGRYTINTGLGARFITDDEKLIVGANVFYDHELQSNHKRTGLGVEALTSLFELRANTYNAISGEVMYEGIAETALDGSDVKFTANLPYFYSSNAYYTASEWKDGLGYKTKTKEWGLQAEILPDFIFGIARQKKDSEKTYTVASLNYSIALGQTAPSRKQMQDGVWRTKFEPIREKLYKPVQRENRIMKKAVKLGLIVTGI